MPNLSASISENVSQVNLAALGIKFPGVPTIVGPYGFVDARARVTTPFLDFNELDLNRAAAGNLAAEKLSYQDARETVVLVVAATYLQAIAAQARSATAEAQVQTAQALYDQAVDQKNAGLSAGIDLLRAQVELQTQQQHLIAARNDFSKQKLSLARIIGLPLAQQFTLTDSAPYEAPAPVAVDDALKLAYASRFDFQSALARVQAAESTRRAATAEHLPSLVGNADYGVIGPAPGQTHGTFDVTAALRIPIFAGNKAHGDALVAQAALDRSRQQLDDLRALIEQEIRTATLDLQSASDQVNVATSSVDLAQQTLTQARDRFRNGVTDNIEVVQAQEAVRRASPTLTNPTFPVYTPTTSLASVWLAPPARPSAASANIGKGSDMAEDNRTTTSVTDPPQTDSAAPPEKRATYEAPPEPRSGRWKIAAIAAVVLLVVGIFVWRYLNTYESTDDAQVDGHLSQISARVAGYITKVNVEDNQLVEKGAVLIEMDPRDYQVAVERAQADLADAEATAQASDLNVPVTSIGTTSQLSSAEADVQTSAGRCHRRAASGGGGAVAGAGGPGQQ